MVPKEDADFSLRKLNREDIEKTFSEIDGLFKKNYKILMSTRMMNDLKHYMRTGLFAWGCMAVELSFDVMPTGEVAPCCDTIDSAFQAPMVKVQHKNFLRRYRNKEFKRKCELRRRRCSGCLYTCYRDPKYLITDPMVQLEALYKSIIFRKALQ